jgi:DNA-binding Lrp family transcriptional regulator
MITTYILMETKVGEALGVAREVALVHGVRSVEAVTGPFDVIARVEAESIHDLAHGPLALIHAIRGVTRTLTCPVMGRAPVWEDDQPLVAADGR